MANRYEHIADDLRHLIAVGTWPAGDRLPAEQELAARYKVSTPTLRNALEVLQSEGLIEKRHGSGNFVRRPGQRMVYANTRLHGTERRAATNAAVSVRCDSRTVEADGQLSLLLHIEVGSPVAEYVFVGHQGASPRSLARIYVPHAVARLGVPEASESAWGDEVRELLSAAGVRVTRTTERVTARFPTTTEAQTLHITTRSPVLAMERVSTDATERVVEGALLVLPGDRTEILFTTGSVPERLEAVR
ncbi:GntR family transcriptional regulator [Streptomyces lushanensis]|uniref:GntR family transcriptional regulator n=1 Tax=Streptomyces lushanensis TaxID=1434255 RepID=UPI0008305E0D|nr:GntR family transcriptional regulator [Streptomyces lushanensis]